MSGDVMGWGYNGSGSLGLGHKELQTSPTKLGVSNPVYISPSNSYAISSFIAISK